MLSENPPKTQPRGPDSGHQTTATCPPVKTAERELPGANAFLNRFLAACRTPHQSRRTCPTKNAARRELPGGKGFLNRFLAFCKDGRFCQHRPRSSERVLYCYVRHRAAGPRGSAGHQMLHCMGSTGFHCALSLPPRDGAATVQGFRAALLQGRGGLGGGQPPGPPRRESLRCRQDAAAAHAACVRFRPRRRAMPFEPASLWRPLCR